MRIFLTIIAVLVLFPAVVIVAILTYFGFMPGLSQALKTNAPRDLGVAFSEADFSAYTAKTGETFETAPLTANPAESLVLEGSVPVTGSFTSAEITSRLAQSKWAYMPLRNPQVKFRPGGLEFSGTLDTGTIAGFIGTIGGLNYTSEDINQGLSLLGKIPANPPVYGSVDAEVTDNSVTLSVKSLTVGKIPVPLAAISADDNFTKLTNHIMGIASGFRADSVRFEEDGLIFSGTVPAKITAGTR